MSTASASASASSTKPLIPGRNSSKLNAPASPSPSSMPPSPVPQSPTLKEVRSHFAKARKVGSGGKDKLDGENGENGAFVLPPITSRSSSRNSVSSISGFSPHSPTASLLSPALSPAPDSSKITDWIDSVGRMRGSPLASSISRANPPVTLKAPKPRVKAEKAEKEDPKSDRPLGSEKAPVSPSVQISNSPSTLPSPSMSRKNLSSSANASATGSPSSSPLQAKSGGISKSKSGSSVVIPERDIKARPINSNIIRVTSPSIAGTLISPAVSTPSLLSEYQTRSASFDELPQRSASYDNLTRQGLSQSLNRPMPPTRVRMNSINPRSDSNGSVSSNSGLKKETPAPIVPSPESDPPPKPLQGPVVISLGPPPPTTVPTPSQETKQDAPKRGIFGTILGFARGATSRTLTNVTTTNIAVTSSPLAFGAPSSPKRTRSDLSDDSDTEYLLPPPTPLFNDDKEASAAAAYPKTLSRSRNTNKEEQMPQFTYASGEARLKGARFAEQHAVYTDELPDPNYNPFSFKINVPSKSALKESQRSIPTGKEAASGSIDDEFAVKAYVDKDTVVSITISRRNTPFSEVRLMLEKKLAKVMKRSGGVISAMRTRDKDDEWVEVDIAEEVDWRIRVSECFEDKMTVYLMLEF
ncbi:hypothetical protein HDU81_010043 [Chytriomyces hyalinus]|nr:hypothetical protein HDU81_010043 [Chytriomyces hyalinus]